MQNQSEEKNSERITIPGIADNIGLGMVVSDETLEHLTDALPGFVLFISPDLIIKQINAALACFLGKDQEAFLGKPSYEAIYGLPSPSEESPLCSLYRSGQPPARSYNDPVFGQVTIKSLPVLLNQRKFAGTIHFIDPVPGTKHSSGNHEGDQAIHKLLDAIPSPSLLCDSSGTIIYASAGFGELTGIVDRNAFAGSNFISFLSHDDIEKALINFTSLDFTTGKANSGRFKVRRVSKDSLLTEVKMSQVELTGLSEKNVLMLFNDISENELFEEVANKNQIRLNRFNKTFLGFSPDPDINISRLITLLGEMLGSSACIFFDGRTGKPEPQISWHSPFMPDFPDGTLESLIQPFIKSNKTEPVILLKPHLTGYFEANPDVQEKFGVKSFYILPLKPADEILGYIVSVFTYNFQLKSGDQEFCSMIASAMAIEYSRSVAPASTVVDDKNYRELFDSVTDSISIIDGEGKILDVNYGTLEMYGYSREELIGKKLEILSAPGKNDLSVTQKLIENAFKGEPQLQEWWGNRKNGEVFPNDLVFNEGRYFGQDVVIVIGRDITKHKEIEDKLFKYNLELKEINRSKDKFFSILAHDLKNPFGGLLGFIDLLYEDIDDLSTSQVKEYLQNIRSASYQTYSLLENLLEWSRIQTGKVQFMLSKFDLKNEVDSVLMVLDANAIHKNIKLVNQVEPGFEAEADRNMIHSVIQNLTTNAIKFSNMNSQVTIKGKLVSRELGCLDPADTSIPERKWYEISVSDMGIGIPEDIMPKLFRLDGQFSMAGTANEPGTGLGLILCKEMVEKNHGRIRAESVAGKGSTFSFTVMLSE